MTEEWTDAYRVELGKRVKCVRELALLSRQELASIANMDPDALEAFEESGECGPSEEELQNLCDALGVDLTFLTMSPILMAQQQKRFGMSVTDYRQECANELYIRRELATQSGLDLSLLIDQESVISANLTGMGTNGLERLWEGRVYQALVEAPKDEGGYFLSLESTVAVVYGQAMRAVLDVLQIPYAIDPNGAIKNPAPGGPDIGHLKVLDLAPDFSA